MDGVCIIYRVLINPRVWAAIGNQGHRNSYERKSFVVNNDEIELSHLPFFLFIRGSRLASVGIFTPPRMPKAAHGWRRDRIERCLVMTDPDRSESDPYLFGHNTVAGEKI